LVRGFHLNRETRRVNYIGWLGQGNLGDEAVYKSVRQLLRCFTLVPATMDYKNYGAVSPVTIVGDSTGIPEWLEKIRPTHYNYIFGSGVKDPSFYGYNYIFHEAMKIFVEMNRLKFFRSIGVRGEFSRNMLAKYGIRSEVIGDVCFSLQPSPSVKRTDDLIAVSVGSDGILWGMDEERLFREVAKVCRTLRKEGYELILLPFWTTNVDRVKKLAHNEGIRFFDEWFSVHSTLDLIAGCKMLIGEKLHSIGLSAAAGTPFVGLEYQPKCLEIAQSVGFDKYMIRTDMASEKNIMSSVKAMFNNYDEMKEKLAEKVGFFRKKQMQFALHMIRDIDSLPELCWKGPRSSDFAKNLFWKADSFLQKKPKVWYAWNRAFFLRTMQYLV
jgi:polysaccharide pyruvyl transferase WcaK-like protein